MAVPATRGRVLFEWWKSQRGGRAEMASMTMLTPCYGSRAWAEMVFGCLGVKDRNKKKKKKKKGKVEMRDRS
jgi:hypothetical protein